MKNKVVSIDVYGDLVAFCLSSKKTVYIKALLLRENCPCAFCSGEKDVFGNVYKGKKTKLSQKAYSIISFSFVGLYGIKFVWGDGHSDGIYTASLIKKLSNDN